MWLFSAAASLFMATPVALTATWQVPCGTKISRNLSLKSIFCLFREIYSSEREIVSLTALMSDIWTSAANGSYLSCTMHVLKKDFMLHTYSMGALPLYDLNHD